MEFSYQGSPLYTPPQEPEVTIGSLFEQRDSMLDGMEKGETQTEQAVDSALALGSTIAGERLVNPVINQGIDKLPLGGVSKHLKSAQGVIPRVLPGAGRFILGSAIPGMGTYMLGEAAAPYVREQSYSHVDSMMEKGAPEGSHPSYFNDQTLIEMANRGDAQAEEILLQRSAIDGIPRISPPPRTEPDVYDNIEASKQASADSMDSPLTAQLRPPPPEFSTDEEFNKWDLDGSGMLSRDEIDNYRSSFTPQKLNLDDF
jgi:hypothetical protein